HAYRCGIDNDVELQLFKLRMRNVMRVRLACELLAFFSRAIHYPHLGIAIFKSENSRPRSAAGADDQDPRACEAKPLFQRTHYAGDIGVKAIKLPILGPNDSVACPDFRA